MMLRLSVLAVIGLTLPFWSAFAVAQDLPAPPEGHVLDLAEVLDATAEARLERVLAESKEKTGVDMDVVTLTDTAGNGGGSEDLEAYAGRLFATWKAEASDASKGILIVVSTDPADARIALGTDYAPVYNDRAARVLGTSVLPAFREGRIPAGIEAGVLSARDQLVVPFLAGAPITALCSDCGGACQHDRLHGLAEGQGAEDLPKLRGTDPGPDLRGDRSPGWVIPGLRDRASAVQDLRLYRPRGL
jgi:TPM domain